MSYQPGRLQPLCFWALEGSRAFGRGSTEGRPPVRCPHSARPRRGRQQSPVLQEVLSPLRGSEMTTHPTGGLPSVDPRPKADDPSRAEEPPDEDCTTLNTSFWLLETLLHVWDGNHGLKDYGDKETEEDDRTARETERRIRRFPIAAKAAPKVISNRHPGAVAGA